MFLPDEYFQDIYSIDFNALKQKGYKLILCDLDNTLVSWDSLEISDRMLSLIEQIKSSGFIFYIVSNNRYKRVSFFKDRLNVPVVYNALKPLPFSFLKILKKENIKKDKVVLIGDQIFTDVLGGNILGFYTILVKPISRKDFFITRFFRLIEKVILKFIRKK